MKIFDLIEPVYMKLWLSIDVKASCGKEEFSILKVARTRIIQKALQPWVGKVLTGSVRQPQLFPLMITEWSQERRLLLSYTELRVTVLNDTGSGICTDFCCRRGED
jgi:hypothetical protein